MLALCQGSNWITPVAAVTAEEPGAGSQGDSGADIDADEKESNGKENTDANEKESDGEADDENYGEADDDTDGGEAGNGEADDESYGEADDNTDAGKADDGKADTDGEKKNENAEENNNTDTESVGNSSKKGPRKVAAEIDDSEDADEEESEETDSTWSDWTAITTEMTDLTEGTTAAPSYYYLSEDVTLNSNLTVAKGAVVILDLNGHTLTGTIVTEESEENPTEAQKSVIVNNGTLTIQDSGEEGTISGNSTMRGIYNTGTLTFNGGTITNCKATDGAGIYTTGTTGKVTFSKGTISGCTANNGGAVGIASNASFVMQGGTISENSASNGGGAIYLDSGYGNNLTITGGTISGNHSSYYGGGIYEIKGQVIVSGGTIENNVAVRNGGGIMCCYGTLTVSGEAQFLNNTAAAGGAIYMQKTLTVSGGYFKGNQATNNGGAICITTGYNTTGTATVEGGIFLENSANYGGAIYCNCTLSVSGESVKITGNTASKSGGAIYAASTVTMSAGTLTGNTATGSGGAIYVDASSGSADTPVTVTIAGGTIQENTATENGGGVCIAGTNGVANVILGANEEVKEADAGEGTVASEEDDTAASTPAQLSITQNKALGLGGGVYLENGTVTMKSGTIERNYEKGTIENDARQVSGTWQQVGGKVTVKVTTGGTSVDGTIEDTETASYYQLVYTPGTGITDVTPAENQTVTIVVAKDAESKQLITLSDTMFTRSGYSISGYQVGSTTFSFDDTENEADTTGSGTTQSTENLTLARLITAAKGSDETSLSGSGTSEDPYRITLTAQWKQVNLSTYTVTIPAEAALSYDGLKSEKSQTIGTVGASISNFLASDRLTIKVSSKNKGLVLDSVKASLPVTYTFADANSITIGDQNVTITDGSNKANAASSGSVNSGGYSVALGNGTGSGSTYYWGQQLTATMGTADVTYAGTYTDTLTFTVSYTGH
jgi:predicted outer membrane repeat protein